MLNKLSKTTSRKTMAEILQEKKIAQELALSSLRNVNPREKEHRIALLVDDSSSMTGKPFEDLREAARKLFLNSAPNNTAYEILFLNAIAKNTSLSCIYQELLKQLDLEPYGHTPLGRAMTKMLSDEIITRAIIISDGMPDDSQEARNAASKSNIPIDTVFISTYSDSEAEKLLREIASLSGGVFLNFNDSVKFMAALRYLTPQHRHLLLDKKQRLLLGSKE